MNRWDSFTFRVNPDERRVIAALAEKLQRTQSDAVRFVILEAAKENQIRINTMPKVRNDNERKTQPA